WQPQPRSPVDERAEPALTEVRVDLRGVRIEIESASYALDQRHEDGEERGRDRRPEASASCWLDGQLSDVPVDRDEAGVPPRVDDLDAGQRAGAQDVEERRPVEGWAVGEPQGERVGAVRRERSAVRPAVPARGR